MAKKHTLSVVRSAPQVIVMPRTTKRRGGLSRRKGTSLRRHARRAGSVARASAPTMGMILGALAVGYAQSKGYLNKIPTIGGSRALTLGAAGYAATRFSKNNTIRTVGLVAMVAGAFDYGRVQGGGKSSLEGDGPEGDTDGDDGVADDF